MSEPDLQRRGWSPITKGSPSTREVTVTGRTASRGTLERFVFAPFAPFALLSLVALFSLVALVAYFSFVTRGSRFLMRALMRAWR